MPVPIRRVSDLATTGPPERMHFLRIDEGADADLSVMAEVHKQAATILKPFISVENYWKFVHHQVFQVYFFGRHLGLDPSERAECIASPFYDRTVDLTTLYDEVSFDPGFESEPLAPANGW